MIYRQKKTSHLALVLLAFLVILFIVSMFIKVSLSIASYGEVFPKEKWILTRGNGGQLISHLIDYTSGHTTKYDISQFERGEYVAVNFSKNIQNRNTISKGDTLVNMNSSDVLDQIIISQGELEVALANLKSQSSSEKEPLISEAENKIKHTEERLNEQKILFDRVKQLYEKGYSSQQELELQKWNLDLLEIEKKINTAQLENLKTGVKPQEVVFLVSQVNAVKQRLKFLKEREAQLTILSPINGKIIASFSPDTLLIVSDINQIVLHVPVKLDQLQEFKVDQIFPISVTTFPNEFTGKIISIDREVRLVTGQQTVFISILMENSSNQLLPGMLLQNKLKIGEVTLWEYFKRMITY
jgi:hypothetical protein